MNLVCALIVATAWAYLACLIYTAMGKPPLIGVRKEVQMVIYGLAFIVFNIVSKYPQIIQLNLFLGVFYGFAALGTFIGYPMRWAAYWKDDPEKGSDIGQIGMAFWDLALAVAFLSLV